MMRPPLEGQHAAASGRCVRGGRLRRGLGRTSAHGDYVVAGDIGGTNARFQLWQMGQKGTKDLVLKMKYPTANFGTFIDALMQFELDCKYEVGGSEFSRGPKSSAFAAAGVVIENRLCTMTNLDWTICSSEIRDKAGWKHASVLNDFEAVGYGVLAVDQEDTHVIHPGNPVPRGPKVVLGPGTGFGQAQLFWNEKIQNHTVMPSEGAHGDFGPRGALQRDLVAFMEAEKGYCELEHVCCGPGLENIYKFLLSREGGSGGSDNPGAPEIAAAALAKADAMAEESVVMLLSILGQEAGNWGLRSLARGGVYIAGGITPKLLPISEETGCLKRAFLHENSRFSKVIESIPLTLITTDDIGLAGSCLYASRSL